MLGYEVHGAICRIPIFDVLVGVGQDSLAYGIHFEVNEAEAALKVRTDRRLTGARRATENKEHGVIL